VHGNIFNSKGVHVAVIMDDAVFGLKGQKLYDLKGSNIYKWSMQFQFGQGEDNPYVQFDNLRTAPPPQVDCPSGPAWALPEAAVRKQPQPAAQSGVI
jgi:hypothetical protein